MAGALRLVHPGSSTRSWYSGLPYPVWQEKVFWCCMPHATHLTGVLASAIPASIFKAPAFAFVVTFLETIMARRTPSVSLLTVFALFSNPGLVATGFVPVIF